MKRIVFIALICLIIGIIGTVIFGGNVFSIGSKNVDEEKQMDGAEIEDLIIDMEVGKVTLQPSEGDTINVDLHGKINRSTFNKLEFDVEQSGNKVVVSVDTSESFGFSVFDLFSFNNQSSLELDIELPDRVLANLDVTTDVGTITIDQVVADRLNVTSDVGNITVNQVNSNQATINSNVGKIVVNQGVGAYQVETDTGKVEMNIEEITEDISILSDVGKVDVTFLKQPENIVLDLQSDVGSISVEKLEGFQDSSEKGLYQEKGSGGPRLQVATDVGKIEVTSE